MNKLSVVIPVYGQWELVKRNVDSLIYYDQNYLREIIVIDDCSPVQNPYSFNSEIVRVIVNKTNLGYSGTVNQGLKTANSNVILLLDSDAYLIESISQRLLEIFYMNSAIGCVGFTTVDNQRNLTGSYCYEPTTLGFIVGQQLEAKLEKFRIWNKHRIMPYSCTVCFRKQCLDELGYLDEKSFPVLDADHDLSMRIHNSKWDLVFSKNIIASHNGGNSYQINYKRVLLFYQSRWRLLKKHKKMLLPGLVKIAIIIRLKIELTVLTILSFLRKNDHSLQEKVFGRKTLLREVPLY